MSHIATGIVQRRRVGSASSKSVLMLMASSASDDGTGIWTSKTNMAADLEISKRTVQRTVDTLLERGLISEIGQRKCRNGFTVEYRINLNRIENLPLTRDTMTPLDTTYRGDTVSPVTPRHPTGDTVSPLGVTQCHPNHTGTIKEYIAPTESAQNLDLDIDGDQVKGFEDTLTKFLNVYPRIGSPEATMAALKKAIQKGADPKHILQAARSYAEEQTGNDRRFIAYSENWLKQKRWEQFTETKKNDPDAVRSFYAKAIKEGQRWVGGHLSAAAARELIALGLVTHTECSAAGVSL